MSLSYINRVKVDTDLFLRAVELVEQLEGEAVGGGGEECGVLG